MTRATRAPGASGAAHPAPGVEGRRQPRLSFLAFAFVPASASVSSGVTRGTWTPSRFVSRGAVLFSVPAGLTGHPVRPGMAGNARGREHSHVIEEETGAPEAAQTI